MKRLSALPAWMGFLPDSALIKAEDLVSACGYKSADSLRSAIPFLVNTGKLPAYDMRIITSRGPRKNKLRVYWTLGVLRKFIAHEQQALEQTNASRTG